MTGDAYNPPRNTVQELSLSPPAFEALIVGRYTQARGMARKSHRALEALYTNLSRSGVIEDADPLRAQFDFLVAA